MGMNQFRWSSTPEGWEGAGCQESATPGWQWSFKVLPHRFSSLGGPAGSGEGGSSVPRVAKKSLEQRVGVIVRSQCCPSLRQNPQGASRDNCPGSGGVVLGEDLAWLRAFFGEGGRKDILLDSIYPSTDWFCLLSALAEKFPPEHFPAVRTLQEQLFQNNPPRNLVQLPQFSVPATTPVSENQLRKSIPWKHPGCHVGWSCPDTPKIIF